jgi:formate-dependent nitrite reductase complex subunit NrfG
MGITAAAFRRAGGGAVALATEAVVKRTILAACLLAAMAYAASGRWQGVIQQPNVAQKKTQLTQLTPRSGDDWARLGDEQLRADRYEEALEAYRQAMRLRGGDARLYAAYGTALYWQAGQTMTPQARAWLDQALESDPQEVTALLLLASEAFMQADYTQAVSRWKQALETTSARVNRERVIEAIHMAQQLEQQTGAQP